MQVDHFLFRHSLDDQFGGPVVPPLFSHLSSTSLLLKTSCGENIFPRIRFTFHSNGRDTTGAFFLLF